LAGEKWNRAAVIISVIALIVTLLSQGVMYYGYYTPTLEINRELAQIVKSQAEKKPILVLTIYPSSAYNLSERYLGQGNLTFIIQNTTLVLSPSYQQIFHIFLSNVGTSPTVAQYLIITYSDGVNSGIQSRTLNATILKPGDSVEWTWAYILSPNMKGPVHGAIAFSVMTTDGTISKVVPFMA
jgi:hypothetical protein